MHYQTVEQARASDTLRLVLVAGTPGVWGEAIKAVFAHKGIEWVAVAQEAGGENVALREWTGQTSAPVLVDEGGLVRTHFEQFIGFAEQRAPRPALLPGEGEARVRMHGLLREIAGVDGFGWCRRLQSFAAFGDPMAVPMLANMAKKYGYSEAAVAAAEARNIEILGLLDAQLAAGGGPYYFGESLTALDFYSAIFLGVMLEPMPHEVIPMDPGMRGVFENPSAELAAAFTPALRSHREMMFADHIETPLQF